MPALTAIDRLGLDVRHPVRRHQLPAQPSSRASTSLGHSWLIEPLSFFFVATVIVTWQSVPFVAFTVYAGLTQVPDEVLEAAAARRRQLGSQRFRLIIVPVPAVDLRGRHHPADHLGSARLHSDLRPARHRRHSRSRPPRSASTSTRRRSAGGDFGTGGAIAVILVIVHDGHLRLLRPQVDQGGGRCERITASPSAAAGAPRQPRSVERGARSRSS